MNQMKLSDFVSQTVAELIDGVRAAQEYAKDRDAKINPKHINWSDTKQAFHSNEDTYYEEDKYPYLTSIEFEVMVTIAQDDKAKGGFGIFAASFGIGLQGEAADRQESLNRIKFEILAKLPQQQ